MPGRIPIPDGPRGDSDRAADEDPDCILRCERHIADADAEGDAPLQAFWHGVKGEYQRDLPGQVGLAIPAHLVALKDGPDIQVGASPVIVGRDPWCDARLDSIRVSRIHCCLTAVDDRVVVLDLGSVNGTRINGRIVELGWLGIGDVLSISHLHYRVEFGQEKKNTWKHDICVIPTSSKGTWSGRTPPRRSAPQPG